MNLNLYLGQYYMLANSRLIVGPILDRYFASNIWIINYKV